MKSINILIITFLFSCYCFGQDLYKMDSLFNLHFKSIEATIDNMSLNGQKVQTYNNDIIFLYVLQDISEFKFEQDGYTHQPMINRKELDNIKKWYKINRKKINCNKIMKMTETYKEYNKTYRIIKNNDPDSYYLYEHILDSLEIRLNEIRQINTYVW